MLPYFANERRKEEERERGFSTLSQSKGDKPKRKGWPEPACYQLSLLWPETIEKEFLVISSGLLLASTALNCPLVASGYMPPVSRGV